MKKNKSINTEENRSMTPFRNINSRLKKIKLKVWAMVTTFLMFTTSAYALPEDGANMTDQLITEVLVWIQRIGAVMTVCSLVSFALAWKSDDSEAKSRSIQFFIASAIILSIKTILSVMGIAPAATP